MEFLSVESFFHLVFVIFSCSIIYGVGFIFGRKNAVESLPFEYDVLYDELERARNILGTSLSHISELKNGADRFIEPLKK